MRVNVASESVDCRIAGANITPELREELIDTVCQFNN
jgi:hypothetical protein